MSTYRIIIADDHPLIREGVKSIIAEMADLCVVGESGDGLALLKMVDRRQPDLVIVDIAMPVLRGIEAAREIKARHAGIAILFLSMHKHKEFIKAAITMGAEGYVLKENAAEDLLTAISAIRKGKTYLSPALLNDLHMDIINLFRGKNGTPAQPLTRREGEILKLIAEGRRDKEIGDLLNISVRTVQTHHRNIRRKLGIQRTAELVRYAIEYGYI